VERVGFAYPKEHAAYFHPTARHGIKRLDR
jgi:hypothetical protein